MMDKHKLRHEILGVLMRVEDPETGEGDRATEIMGHLIREGYIINPEYEAKIPLSALQWLFGDGPDKDGLWFGEVQSQIKDSDNDTASGKWPKYWWRSHFRKLIAAGGSNGK